VSTNFAWTAALIGAACVGVMRAAFDHAVEFARKDARSGPHPIIEYSTVGYMLADMKMKIEACRYLTWKACQQYDLSKGREHELAGRSGQLHRHAPAGGIDERCNVLPALRWREYGGSPQESAQYHQEPILQFSDCALWHVCKLVTSERSG
jgi:hypothetical protein